MMVILLLILKQAVHYNVNVIKCVHWAIFMKLYIPMIHYVLINNTVDF